MGWTNEQPLELLLPPGANLNLPHRLIGPDIPAVLVNFSPDYTWLFADLWFYDANAFYFEALAVNSVFGLSEWIAGTYDLVNGVQPDIFIDGPGGAPRAIHYGSDNYATANRLRVDYRTTDVVITPTATLTIQGSIISGGGQNVPFGIMAPPTTTALNGTVFTATEQRDAVLGDYVFTAVAGRRYRIWYADLLISGTTPDVAEIKIRDGGAVTPTTASPIVAAMKFRIGATGGTGQETSVVVKTVSGLTAGVHTLSAFGQLTLNNDNTTPVSLPESPRELYVEDVGT